MSLQILDQFPFEFYGEYFTVALASDRKVYVPMNYPAASGRGINDSEGNPPQSSGVFDPTEGIKTPVAMTSAAVGMG